MKPPSSVIKEANRLWSLDIRDTARDPASMAQIDRIIRSEDCLGWTWVKEYKRNKQYAWCAAFVAACWRTAGLHPELARYFFSSCYRLDRWSQYKGFGDFQYTHVSVDSIGWCGPVEPVHAIAGGIRLRVCADCECDSLAALWTDHNYTPKPGDIATVGNGKPHGTHCVLVAGCTSHAIQTIEGNAKGNGPEANWREGVVIRSRPISTFARFYRPAPLDLCPGARYYTEE